jgi:hypothetical protein
MQTLTYGFKKPQTGDKGSIFFPALEDNIQQLNDHTHNGVNSSRLTTQAVASLTTSILSAAWSSLGDGNYRQLVTMPGGLDYDECVVSIKDDATGNILFLSIEKVSDTTFYVYTNDNSLDLLAVYTS